jgi:hypothetical protein
VRGPLGAAGLDTSGDASSGFVRVVVVVVGFFLARAFVGVAPALATGPLGTTAARNAVARREHTRPSLQRKTRRRNQGRHPRQKLHRRPHEVRRAVAPRLAKQVRHAAIRQDRVGWASLTLVVPEPPWALLATGFIALLSNLGINLAVLVRGWRQRLEREPLPAAAMAESPAATQRQARP